MLILPARLLPVARVRRGATLILALIALLILMIGAAAIVRSMNTSMSNTGNLSFKRDLTNQAERAADQVMTMLRTGALATETERQADDVVARNYNATILQTTKGIPNALLVSDGDFDAARPAGVIRVNDQRVVLRWVLDRLCNNTGPADETHCTMSDARTGTGESYSQRNRAQDASATGAGALQRQVVYRLSIRATGPRDTQSFLQTTFTL